MSDQEKKPQQGQEKQENLSENELENVSGGAYDTYRTLDPSIVKATPMPQGKVPIPGLPIPDPKLKP